MEFKPPKPKYCKVCGDKFTPKNSIQPVCDKYECKVSYAIAYAERTRKRLDAKKAKDDRKALREKKERLKTRSDWMKDVQRVFNRYIVKRDEYLPCISCEKYILESGFWSCGHMRTVGSSPHMRFVEDNTAKQCSSCNSGSEMYIKKRERVATAYERNLRLRIGDKRVDAVKSDNTPRHYTIDDLKELKKHYQAKIKEMENK